MNRGCLSKTAYKVVSSPGTARSSGVAILYQPSFSLEAVSRDQAGRFIVAVLSDGVGLFQIASIYGPNNKRDGIPYFESLVPSLQPDVPMILCGDFNTVLNPGLDRFGCNITSPWAYNAPSSLGNLMSTFELIDIWRKRNPTKLDYTWRRPCGSQASRLDMFLVSSALVKHVAAVEILPFFRSDHNYVYMEFCLPSSIELGPGYWKFNSSHLSSSAFVEEIKSFWERWRLRKPSFSSLAAWWDIGKVELRKLIRRFSIRKAKRVKQQIKSLEATVFHLNRRLTLGDDVAHLLRETNHDLELHLLERARGAQVRARVKWAEEGERSTAYFFRQERFHSRRSIIGSISRPDGTLATSSPGIRDVFRDFYRTLFTAGDLDDSEQRFFLSKIRYKLSRPESSSCDGDLSNAECLVALKGMSRNRSPGLDGLPAEFYLRFWEVLGEDYTEMINSCYHRGRLTESQRSGLITLLFKKGDRNDPINWRPITLLCVDYKIASKAITNRLLTVLSSIISASQTGGIPGRFSAENVRVLQDIVCYANANAVPAAVLSLDQEKAFDRVEWSFTRKVLAEMGFGDSFCRWVDLFYTNISSSVIVNGFVSRPFQVHRGVRQGCPLSPLLYVLVIEALASAIHLDPAIDGFPLPDGTRQKLCQYADDTTALATSDDSIVAIFSIFSRYEHASGAKLNQGKCHGLLLGPWRTRSSFPVPLNWTASSIKVLGCSIANVPGEDWDTPLKKYSDLVDKWKRRALSFRGRTLISKVLGLSLFWYLATVTEIPPAVVKRINALTFSFIWGKKREWLSRSSVTQLPCDGGLGAVDVARKMQSLHCLWIKRYLLGPRHGWHAFFEYYIGRAFPGCSVFDVLSQDCALPQSLRLLPSFYASSLRSWLALHPQLDRSVWSIPTTSSTVVELPILVARKAYSFLRQPSDHRCLAKFASLGFTINWPWVWQSLTLFNYTRSVQDSSWLTFHGILPTADRLIRFGQRVDSACFCSCPETLMHLFTECHLAIDVLDWFLPVLRRFQPGSRYPTDSEIIFGFDPIRKIPWVFSALLGIIRHHLWLARNAYRFDQVDPDLDVIIGKIKSTTRFLLKLQHRNCRANHFEFQWLANGVVGLTTPEGDLVIDPSFS